MDIMENSAKSPAAPEFHAMRDYAKTVVPALPRLSVACVQVDGQATIVNMRLSVMSVNLATQDVATMGGVILHSERVLARADTME